MRAPFTYVGGQRFILGGTADAEQHLYVVADSAKVVRRLYWIQIEEMLPMPSGQYDYSTDSLRIPGEFPYVPDSRESRVRSSPRDRGVAERLYVDFETQA